VFSSSFFDKIAVDKQAVPRFPFSGSIGLRDLSPGAYILKLAVEDRLTKRTAFREEAFIVE